MFTCSQSHVANSNTAKQLMDTISTPLCNIAVVNCISICAVVLFKLFKLFSPLGDLLAIIGHIHGHMDTRTQFLRQGQNAQTENIVLL